MSRQLAAETRAPTGSALSTVLTALLYFALGIGQTALSSEPLSAALVLLGYCMLLQGVYKSWRICVELCSFIEDLREKREEVNRSIAKDEEEKGAGSSWLR